MIPLLARLGLRRGDDPQSLHARQSQRRAVARSREGEGDRGDERRALCERRPRQGLARLSPLRLPGSDDAALEPIRRIEAIAARYHVPLGAAALQFSLRDERVTSTVCGVTKPERVKETLDWARFPIPEAFWQEVASLPFATDDPEATRAHQKA